MWFDINYKKLAILLLPVKLRKIKTVALVQSLTEGIATLHYKFMRKREDDLYRIAHNGQVCYLRKALNNKFDIQLRRIKIVDASKYKQQYIYTDAEQKPRFLGTMYLRQDSDFADTGVDFIVLLPFELWNRYKIEVAGNYKFYEIESLVDFYRLASKRYRIDFY